MVFDGMDTAPERTLDLANIDADSLLAQRDALDDQKADDAEPSTERLVLNYDPADVVPFRPTQQTGLESYGGEGR
jgi:hypothetical protein